jgi:hypothetical protein
MYVELIIHVKTVEHVEHYQVADITVTAQINIMEILVKKVKTILLNYPFLHSMTYIEYKSTGYNTKNPSKKDQCSSSPCRNSGECILTSSTYYCRCKTPYYGLNCDKRKFYLNRFLKINLNSSGLSKREAIVEQSIE